MKRSLICCILICTSAFAQTYAVHPEWVKAHEDFLASDALQGRGSATRDEQIAAAYVASQFEAFGLKSHVESIELHTFQLDGKAELRIGDRVLHEGTDFYILTSSGVNVTGISPDALSFVEGTKAQLERFAAGGATTRVATSIQGIPVTTVPPTRVMLKVGPAPKNGETASLAVHSTPVTKFTYNAMGTLPGRDSSADTILITAHLDHLGIGPPVEGDSIYNGANDDASGVTAVLEIARALASGPAPRRNVLFVCFGSEEAGGFGDRFFRENPPVPLKDIAANLEFEMIGVAQEGVPPGTMFLSGYERSDFGPAMKEHGALIGPDPFPKMNFFRRSDNYALAQKGVVAHTAAAGGEVPTYHKPNDDVEHIDIALMTQLIQSMIEPLRWLADSDFKPAWNPGGQP